MRRNSSSVDADGWEAQGAHKVSISVDAGSSNNFVSKQTAKAYGCSGCQVVEQPNFKVLVGNDFIKGRCPRETVEIQV